MTGDLQEQFRRTASAKLVAVGSHHEARRATDDPRGELGLQIIADRPAAAGAAEHGEAIDRDVGGQSRSRAYASGIPSQLLALSAERSITLR